MKGGFFEKRWREMNSSGLLIRFSILFKSYKLRDRLFFFSGTGAAQRTRRILLMMNRRFREHFGWSFFM